MMLVWLCGQWYSDYRDNTVVALLLRLPNPLESYLLVFTVLYSFLPWIYDSFVTKGVYFTWRGVASMASLKYCHSLYPVLRNPATIWENHLSWDCYVASSNCQVESSNGERETLG